ncbi:SDR family NAD(P)-dependent oxidoreductase [Nakamurella leprariae]|uniref:SDR family oxidoreductase n=1 Tax=Nakamurella leprariae TaxID=2803911 RepID=A0A938YE30_9ACTN|nr:SDR family oxidoreductase [Nakamurella leprariae]MBM9466484.1 SDR family oxidoreductase [Nakamurella leprariae]
MSFLVAAGPGAITEREKSMENVVVVVGGAGGIGAACAQEFRDQGRTVVLVDRALGHDASDPDSVRRALQDVPSVTALVHAAGSVGSGGIDGLDLVQWRRVLDDNLTSAAVVSQQVLPRMPRGGSVVLFSSVNGRHGGNRLSGPAYAAAKAAIIGLTRHLAKDQGPRGVRVNALAPGPVSTPMLHRLSETEIDRLRAAMPLGELTTPEEVAGTVAFLCSPAAASITGTVIDMNGGSWMG